MQAEQRLISKQVRLNPSPPSPCTARCGPRTMCTASCCKGAHPFCNMLGRRLQRMRWKLSGLAAVVE